LRPVTFPIVESDAPDPVTFQPITGPDLANPRPIGLFVEGFAYKAKAKRPKSTGRTLGTVALG